MTEIQNSKQGYIAITVSLVLSLVVVIVAITLGSANLFTRFGAADFANKQSSFVAARSCLNQALLKLAENSGYAGSEILGVSQYQCSILPIETSGPNKIIKARSQVSGAVTNLKLTVDASTLSTVSLEEAVKF